MILNLTQHQATAEQIEAGVVDLPADKRAVLVDLLTVNYLPTRQEIKDRCKAIAALALSLDSRPNEAMIGGAPWMMSCLETTLIDSGIEPVYAFSVRESAEQVQPDGTVLKVNKFRHAGFVPAR